MLEQDQGLIQLSTGDLLRAAVNAATEAGRAAKGIMESGGWCRTPVVQRRPARKDGCRGTCIKV